MKGKILDYNIQESKGVISGDDGQRYSFENKDWKASELPKVNQIVDFEVDELNAFEIYLVKQSSYNLIIQKLKQYYIIQFMLGVILYFSMGAILQAIIDSNNFKDGLEIVSFVIALLGLFGLLFSFGHFNILMNVKYNNEKDNKFPIFIIGNLFLITSSLFLIKTSAKYLEYLRELGNKPQIFNYHTTDYDFWIIFFCLGIVSYLISMSRYMTITVKMPMIKSIAINSTLFVILLIIIYFLLKNTSETNYGHYLFYNLVVLSLGLLISILFSLITLVKKKKKSLAYVNISGFNVIGFAIIVFAMILTITLGHFQIKENNIFILIILNIICLTLYIISHTLQHYSEQALEDSIIYKVNTKD